MATAELKTYIEDRLSVLSPGIDLEPGSPAQVQFITPLLEYLGTDPFETDIETFLTDRFAQEFPEVYAGDPGVIRDSFVNPLIMFLEPFKRETQSVRRGQSLKNPDILSDEDADALVANFFEERSTGGFATGTARVFFTNPTNVQIEITTRFYTAAGLSFFPTNPRAVTAEEMVFNKQGSLYFVDIPVQAEKVGTEYNIDVAALVGVEGLFNPVQVSNPQKFSDGSVRIDTPTFIASAREALNERSLVTRRGGTARLNEVFQGDLKAVQIIGAQDPEMQRDILVATSPGHAWLTGSVGIYGNVAFVQCRTVDDPSDTPTVSPGDSLYVYLDKYSYAGYWSTLDQSKRFVRFTVEEVLSGPFGISSLFQLGYLVRFSGSFPTGVTLPGTTVVLEGGLTKKGTVAVSSLPSIGSVNLTVNNQSVHVYGHSDIYVRPVLQPSSKAVLESLTNDVSIAPFKIQRLTLQTYGQALTDKNKVTDVIDFGQSGVEVSDIIVIETGDDAGSYQIIKVSGSTLYLSQNLTKTSAANIRYSISKSINFNLFEPRILKIPFGSIANNDLQTSIGSKTLSVINPSTNFIELGAAVGDTLRILNGPDAGDYTIEGFSVDGKQFYVNVEMTSTSTNLSYEVFTPLDPVLRPLVRVKKISVLDSSKQSSGITIPPAEPVGVVPLANVTSAMVRGKSQTRSGIVLPALTAPGGTDDYVTGVNVAALGGDRRYSLGFESFDGMYKSVVFTGNDAGTLDPRAEFLFPTDADEVCSYFLAVSEDNYNTTNYPPVDPKPGDALTIKNGPNKGSYTIKSVRKFKHTNSDNKAYWTYFIKIYGKFPVDVIRSLIEFFDAMGVTTSDIKISGATTYPISYPGFFVNAYNSFGAKLHSALVAASASSPGATALQDLFEAVVNTDYEWGDPARGTMRTYFQEPTLFQQHTAENSNPTLYDFKTSSGDIIKFRPDPYRYEKHEVIPPRLETDTDPLEYRRDYSQNGTLANFSDTSYQNMRVAGVQIGDWLSVHPEILFHRTGAPTPEDRMTAVQTTANSSRITAPTASGSVFSSDMVGNLIFIDEGDDQGGYRVTEFIDDKNLGIDRALTRTTPAIIAEGNGASWGYDGGLTENKLVAPASVFSSGPHANKYMTLYGMKSDFQGTYKIKATSPFGTTVYLDRTGMSNFPAYPASAIARWVITESPITPVNTTDGTELVGLQPIRMYNDVTVDAEITDISTDPAVQQVTAGSRQSGVKEPFRIYRKNVRRINPTEMELNKEGPFFYFDTDVISLGPQESSNIKKGSYLEAEVGTYDSYGYRHVVDDNTLTYSNKETGHIEVPNKILPLQSPDGADSMLSLAGVPVQIDYDQSELVQRVQDFISSPDDRVTAANLLARHFLPAYLSYEATYVGGSAPSVIAKDIISYIESLSIETPADVSEVEKLIVQRGGNPQTPTSLYSLIHDWDRKQWAEINQNELGGRETAVPYNGTPRVSFFSSGPDVSGQSPIPVGEIINLVRV